MDPTIWVLAAIAFVPAFAFLLWVRAREVTDREPMGAVLGLFLHGATLGILVALVVSVGLASAVGGSIFLAAVVIAPLVEEPSKVLGLRFVRRHVDELEDGLVYGIAVGLGFAATETFLYGLMQLQDADAATALSVVAARNISSLLLHASTSGLLGFAYATYRVAGAPFGHVVRTYLLAAALHAVYNALVLLADWVGFIVAIAMVAVLMWVLLRKVRTLDASGTPVA